MQAGQHRCFWSMGTSPGVPVRQVNLIFLERNQLSHLVGCMEVEAELSFLEQDILEKFRNQASAGMSFPNQRKHQGVCACCSATNPRPHGDFMIRSCSRLFKGLSLCDDILPSDPVALVQCLLARWIGKAWHNLAGRRHLGRAQRFDVI